MSAKKYQESVRIQQLRSEDHHLLAHAAYSAAERHLGVIGQFSAVHSTDSGPELHARIRSFFWEMMSAYDLFHVWANTHYNLGLTGRKLTPENVQKAMKNDLRCADAYDAFREAEESPWLFEVRTYRNYAHRSYLGAETIILQRDNSSMTFLVPARHGQQESGMQPVFDQLNTYLEAMNALGVLLDGIKKQAGPKAA
ncbi:TPA: hypothetical protein SAY52_001009 [Burkholderia cenocepacia]|uniref:hypothetical protein n=1 Tax=unclassified Burkholderia TaxID=2613784 RepID=UPI00158EA2B8|nr:MULTISPECIES: hypothetical protein [unclassified Burkholderia]HEF5870441.1 hypothetical protein [Burkholderia cenocepacia]